MLLRLRRALPEADLAVLLDLARELGYRVRSLDGEGGRVEALAALDGRRLVRVDWAETHGGSPA